MHKNSSAKNRHAEVIQQHETAVARLKTLAAKEKDFATKKYLIEALENAKYAAKAWSLPSARRLVSGGAE